MILRILSKLENHIIYQSHSLSITYSILRPRDSFMVHEPCRGFKTKTTKPMINLVQVVKLFMNMIN